MYNPCEVSTKGSAGVPYWNNTDELTLIGSDRTEVRAADMTIKLKIEIKSH